MTHQTSSMEVSLRGSGSGLLREGVLSSTSVNTEASATQHRRSSGQSRGSGQGRSLLGRLSDLAPSRSTVRRIATTENIEGRRPPEADLSREKSRKAIEDQKILCGHRRDIDVLELFLSRKGLIDVIDLSKFRRLKHLWLSFNKLEDIKFLLRNHCLVELYLNNNSLYAIDGFRSLVSLNILMLHNNQLKNLDAVVDELKKMHNLKMLNLYRNPMSQDSPQYRLYTVYHLPSVWLLDRKEITLKERRAAIHLFDHEKSRISQMIAFGKKVDKPLFTAVPFTPLPTMPTETIWANHLEKVLFHDLEDAVFVRSMKRSVTQFSCLDWSTVPTRVERHSESKAESPIDWMTVRIR